MQRDTVTDGLSMPQPIRTPVEGPAGDLWEPYRLSSPLPACLHVCVCVRVCLNMYVPVCLCVPSVPHTLLIWEWPRGFSIIKQMCGPRDWQLWWQSQNGWIYMEVDDDQKRHKYAWASVALEFYHSPASTWRLCVPWNLSRHWPLLNMWTSQRWTREPSSWMWTSWIQASGYAAGLTLPIW